MDRIGIGGLSLQAAGLAELEGLKGCVGHALDDFLRELADALFASELVLLSTCNRVEVVFGREEGHAPGVEDLPALGKALGADAALIADLQMVTGRGALQHLFRVASGLDSVVQGEDQILGQVREAFLRSQALGLTGPLLEPMFEGALQVGKQVRTQTTLSRHPISVTSVGVALLRARAAHCEWALRAAVVGAGATGRLAAQTLKDQGFDVRLIINRSPGPALRLAGEYGARALSLEEFKGASAAELGGIDVLVSATSATGIVIDRARLASLSHVASAGRGLLALDLALPRDLESCAGVSAVEIIDLEQVQRAAKENKALRASAALEAEVLVERKLQSFERKATEKRANDQIASFLRDSDELLQREMKSLSSGPLASLSASTRAGVLHWAHTALGRANHLSLAFCKRMAREVPQFDERDEEETTG